MLSYALECIRCCGLLHRTAGVSFSPWTETQGNTADLVLIWTPRGDDDATANGRSLISPNNKLVAYSKSVMEEIKTSLTLWSLIAPAVVQVIQLPLLFRMRLNFSTNQPRTRRSRPTLCSLYTRLALLTYVIISGVFLSDAHNLWHEAKTLPWKHSVSVLKHRFEIKSWQASEHSQSWMFLSPLGEDATYGSDELFFFFFFFFPNLYLNVFQHHHVTWPDACQHLCFTNSSVKLSYWLRGSRQQKISYYTV